MKSKISITSLFCMNDVDIVCWWSEIHVMDAWENIIRISPSIDLPDRKSVV